MEHIAFGNTGLQVSRMGLGGIPIQKTDAACTGVIVRRLLSAGVNYIDTARGYSVSEAYLGQALAGIRQHFVLATKSMARDAAGMEKDIDISLKNLQTDYIDVYQIHNPTPEEFEKVLSPGGALEALLKAKAAGKIGHIGFTTHSLELFRKALELPWVESIMYPYNIVENQAEELIAACKEKNIAFVAMKPLAGGAISDARLAMRYISQNPNITVVIPGMESPEQVRENLEAFCDSTPLSAAEEEKIADIRNTLGTRFCRRCNYCAPCTVGMSIPGVFLMEGYLSRYGLEEWAKQRYNGMAVTASACVECGACEERCPYHLPIRKMLKTVAEKFGK